MLNDTDLADLARYKALLEQPSFVSRATNLIGTPIEKGIERLPANWRQSINEATRSALGKSLKVAIGSMDAGHFGVRRLERRYGTRQVQQAYQRITFQ